MGAENASTNASWLFSGTEIFGGRLMKKFGLLGVTLFVVLIALGSFGSAARADVVYEYSGSNFTSFSGGYTSGDSISGSLVLASALGDNLNLASVNPTSFSFSDGIQTISNTSNLASTQFWISTNASGDITGWAINLHEWWSAGNGQHVIATDFPSPDAYDTAGFVANVGWSPSITAAAYAYQPGVWLIGRLRSAGSGGTRAARM